MRLAALCLLLVACDCGSDPGCVVSSDCPMSSVCVDGACVPPSSDGGRDAGGDADASPDATASCDGGVTCGAECCGEGQRCHSTVVCVADLGPCSTNDDCAGDSYCDDGTCTPYGVPPDVTSDPECQRDIEVGAFLPAEQCRWSGEGPDEFSTWSAVYSTPTVADFDLDDDADVLAPSIVFGSFASSRTGSVLRILDGRTCEPLFTLEDPADRLIYASQFAIGDLDGGGTRPEIVGTSLMAPESPGGLVAFEYAEGTFRRRWYGRRCDLPGEPRHIPNDWQNNDGPSMHDLDDDGVPELLFREWVYDASGCLLNPDQVTTNYLGLGFFAVAADVDEDGEPELVTGEGVYRWTGSAWVLEDSWAPTDPEATRVGHAGVADIFPEVPGAEIMVVSSVGSSPATGMVRVMDNHGAILFGPYPLPAESDGIPGRGGPPTIGDFDGDGRREFAVAGGSRYTVFDVDCDTDGEAAGCTREAGLPRGVLWSRRSQDNSSNVTGSSVFDFDADGVAEVVYGDECFVRIYRGTDGEVLFSQSASSGTGYELPVIADVDGDFNSEIVVAMTRFTACPATDPIYSRGESAFVSQAGIVVLRDAMDRWAASRPIWNQHAYSVTNVEDDGTIPRTSAWMANHQDDTLNNFRMNAQGSLERRGAADLTVALDEAICESEGGDFELAARVCNRGTNPVPDGARVVFYDGDPDASVIACETVLPRLLEVGACTRVACTATLAEGRPEITVVVDPDGEVFECRDGNNRGLVPSRICLL